MKKYNVAFLCLMMAGTVGVSGVWGESLPRPEKPGFMGCTRDIGNPESPRDLAKALWCLKNTDDKSDKNFWAAAKKNMPARLKDYDNADSYLNLLGFKTKEKSAGFTNKLPAPQKPTFGCKSSLGDPRNRVEWAQALWCINNRNANSDPNFWGVALKILPEQLKAYVEQGDPNAQDYLDKLDPRNRAQSESSKPRLPVSHDDVGYFSCTTKVAEASSTDDKSLATALGCLKRNMAAIDYPDTPIDTNNPENSPPLPDPNFVLRVADVLLGKRGQSGVFDTFDDRDTQKYRAFLGDIRKAWENAQGLGQDDMGYNSIEMDEVPAKNPVQDDRDEMRRRVKEKRQEIAPKGVVQAQRAAESEVVNLPPQRRQREESVEVNKVVETPKAAGFVQDEFGF